MFGLSKEPLTFQYIEDLVDEYGAVRSDQLLRLYENMGIPRKKAEKAINSVKNLASRIFYDKNADTYYSNSYEPPSMAQQFAMDQCFWVMLDFINKVENHFPVGSYLSPSQICLMLEDRSYEIAYCRKGMGAYFNNQLRAARIELLCRAESAYFAPIVEKDDKAVIEAAKYIVVVENIEDAGRIRSQQIAFFVTLDEENVCTFYSAEEVYEAMPESEGGIFFEQ